MKNHLSCSGAFRVVVAFCVFAGLIVLGGCRAGGRGELPLGEWNGDGVFVYQQFHDSPEATADAADDMVAGESISRWYSTELKLSQDRLEGQDIVRMEIRSRRGEIPDLDDDETHLILALVPGRRLNDDVQLYRALAMQVNPDPDDEMSIADDAPPMLATCVTRGNVTTFAINYMDNFADVFRFSGGQLEKTGTFFSKEKGFVHWVERLKRR